MNHSFPLKQMSTTSNFDSRLISHQYKLILMATFMQNKIENPKIETI